MVDHSNTSDRINTDPISFLLSLVVTGGLIIFVLCLTYAPLHLQLGEKPSLLLISDSTVTFIGSFLVVVTGLVSALFFKRVRLLLRLEIIALAAAALFLTDLSFRPYTLFQRESIQLIALGAFLLSPLFLWLFRYHTGLFFHLLLLGSSVFGVLSFLDEANGRLLFSDDHASFLLRFMQLKKEFPAIPFYSPLWNAGYDAREFFPSGCLNFFFLFSPLIYLFEVPDIYTVLIALLLFVALPLSAYSSATILDFSPLTRALAGLFVLVPSLFWYRWALVYGTVGFITSCIFLLPTYALWTLVLDRETTLSPFKTALTIVCTTMAIFWTPASLTLVPIGLIGLFQIRRLVRERAFILIVASLIALNLPWTALFIKSSHVTSFVSSTSKSNRYPKSSSSSADKETSAISKASAVLHSQSSAINPLILLLGIIGTFCLWKAHDRLVFGSLIGWLLILALFIGALKPQLELDRMIVLLSLVLAVTAAGGIDSFLSHEATSVFSRATLLSVCLGFITLGVVVLSDIVRNDSILKYYHASPVVADLSEAVSAFHNQGRVLFAGFSLHELSNGHLAPLSLFTGVPLIASSFQHNLWKYTDVIPKRFRKNGEKGVLDYLNLMNATVIVTHDKKWQRWFGERPELFEKIWEKDRFVLYKRKKYLSNYFLEGTGSVVKQTNSDVTLWIEDERSVIKFTYFPFIQSTRCTVSPYQITRTLSFIELSGCPVNSEVTLRSANAFERLIGLDSDITLPLENSRIAQ
jgi:hypothetical protein